jgi:HEAT repeat protein
MRKKGSVTARVGDSNWRVRRAACVEMGESGGARAVELLIERLGDGSQSVRRAACGALGKLGDQRASDPLLECLGSADRGLREAARKALERLGESGLASAFLEALEGSREALAQIGGRLGVEARLRERLLSRLGSPRKEVRRAAGEVFARLGPALAVQPLLSRLEEANRNLRQAACEALGALGDAGAVEPLIQRLDDRAPAVRRAACEALGKLGDTRAAAPLVPLVAGPDWQTAALACGALERLGEGRLAGAVYGGLNGQAEALRELTRLGEEGDSRAMEPLLARLGHRNPSEQAAAAKAVEALSAGLRPKLSGMVCRRCLARFELRSRRLSLVNRLTWCACRECGKAGQPFTGIERVVMVLDEDWRGGPACSGGVLRVNWLERRALCDFDALEIRRASDFEVERFCIAVGNDADEWRRTRTGKATCVVAPECRLSDNALRILRSMFRER